MLADPEVRGMPKVSIFAVVYRSIDYARFISQVVRDSCPELATGEAEFFLVANQPEAALKAWLERSEVPYIEYWPSLEPTVECGPTYLAGVYAAYNHGVEASAGDVVVMLNSDMVPSPGWLRIMLEEFEPTDLLSPWLVEPFHPKYGVFPGAIEENFGRSPGTFQAQKWEEFCTAKIARLPEVSTPPFMPVMVKKDKFLQLGGYPEGNLMVGGNCVPADVHYFEALSAKGMSHRSSSSPVYFYHFKEGEKRTETFFRIWTDALPSIARKLRVDKLLHCLRRLRIKR
jgi:hypothetical protein